MNAVAKEKLCATLDRVRRVSEILVAILKIY